MIDLVKDCKILTVKLLFDIVFFLNSAHVINHCYFYKNSAIL